MIPGLSVSPRLLLCGIFTAALFGDSLKLNELRFEPNLGQFRGHARFAARTARGAVLFTEDGFEIDSGVRVVFRGASRHPVITAEEPAATRLNYFIGKDARKWRANVGAFDRLRYHGLWPGIDVVFHGSERNLEYDFVVQPGADPWLARIGFRGVHPALTSEGDAIAGSSRHLKPRAYQESNGVRREVAASFELRDDEVAFRLGDYDRNAPLVIDPVLVYSTYLGGETLASYGGPDPVATSVVADAQGASYMTGYTFSQNFPTTPGVVRPQFGTGSYHSYVSKLDPTGSKLLFSTYLGGDQFDEGTAIAVDPAGNVYVTGTTNGSNFPTTPGAYRRTSGVYWESYLVKLSPDGSRLLYSTFLGPLVPRGLAVDAAGNAYVAGTSQDTGLTTTIGAYQTTPPGSNAPGNGYIMKLNPAGSALVYATYVGGSVSQRIQAMALDGGGNVYAAGSTSSPDFPVTPSAAQPKCGSQACANTFVVKLYAAGSRLLYSTFLGGSRYDFANAIAIDSAGSAYVTGLTSSPDFPVTPGALQPAYDPGGGQNAPFITKLDPTGSRFLFSTYLGPPGTSATANAIAVDSNGRVLVTGTANSFDFPVTPDAFQSTPLGYPFYLGHGFLSEIDATGSKLLYSTWLSGSFPDSLNAMTLAPSGDLYLVGQTLSSDWPTTPGAFSQGAYHASYTPVALRVAVGDLSPYPSSFDFADVLPHGQPAVATLNVYAPETPLAFDAAADSSWLSLVPAEGTATAPVQVGANPAGLTPGAYSGNISIAVPAGKVAPRKIPVTMEIVTLGVSPQSLDVAAPRTLLVTGGNAVSFTATSDADWLIPGVGAGVTPARLQISANTQSLATGSYSATLTIVPKGSPGDAVAIPVTLSIP
jgi:hypothetical protein